MLITITQKKFVKIYKTKSLGTFDDFCVQSDTLLLADEFKNFPNMCLEIYELYPAHFLTEPGLAWQAALRKAKVKLDLLADFDMLLIEKKVSEYVMLFNGIQKLITNIWKIMIEVKNHHMLGIET